MTWHIADKIGRKNLYVYNVKTKRKAATFASSLRQNEKANNCILMLLNKIRRYHIPLSCRN